MKLIISFLLLFGSLIASGQSAKKMNKKLLAEFALEEQKQDSAFAVFTQTKREFDSIKRLTNQKSDLLAEDERRIKKFALKIDEAMNQLKELGIDPNPLITPTNLKKDGFPGYREFVRPIKEPLKTEAKFNKVSNRLYLELEGLKMKEKNTMLTEKVNEYKASSKYNVIHQENLELASRQLIAFLPKLDSMSHVYQSIGMQLTTNRRNLEDKLNELRTNYIEKGPHGFPEAYKRVFYDAFPPTQEEMTREVAISTSEWADGGYPVVEGPPVDQSVYTYVEEPASFPGGNEALNAFIVKNLRIPEKLEKMGVSGKVAVSFIVSETSAF